MPVGQYESEALPLLHATSGLHVIERLELRGGSAVDVTELSDGSDGASARLVVATANRAFVYDRRAGPSPCARLALPQIVGLAATSGAEQGAPPALLAASGSEVRVYDVRKLPEDTKQAKLPPALATLAAAQSDGQSGGGLAGVAAMGRVVIASDRANGLNVWDVGAPHAEAEAELT